MQPRCDSRIADSFASRGRQIVRRPSSENITVGIILLVLGVLAAQVSQWLAWFTVGCGLLLLTWRVRMRPAFRGLLYFFASLPVLHWFNSAREFAFHQTAASGAAVATGSTPSLELVCGIVFVTAAVAGLLFVVRHRPGGPVSNATAGGKSSRGAAQARWSNIPARTFADVGGFRDALGFGRWRARSRPGLAVATLCRLPAFDSSPSASRFPPKPVDLPARRPALGRGYPD